MKGGDIMATYNIDMTVGERLMAQKLLNEAKGELSLDGFRDAIDLTHKLRLTEEEVTKVGYRLLEPTEMNPNGGIQWDDLTYSAAIAMDGDQYKLLRRRVEKRDEDAKFSLEDGDHMLTLADKLMAAKSE